VRQRKASVGRSTAAVELVAGAYTRLSLPLSSLASQLGGVAAYFGIPDIPERSAEQSRAEGKGRVAGFALI